MKKYFSFLFVIVLFSCASTDINLKDKEKVSKYDSIESAVKGEAEKENEKGMQKESIVESNKKVIEAVEKTKPSKVFVKVPIDDFKVNKADKDEAVKKPSADEQLKTLRDNISLSVSDIKDDRFINALIEYNYIEEIIFPVITTP